MIQYVSRFWKRKGGRDTKLHAGNALVARLFRSLLDRGTELWLESPVEELLVEEGRVVGAVVRRGAKVRLLRDSVVIHEGSLSTLKRFKDDVREVNENYECGMSFENYNDLKVGDVIECFDIQEIAPTL